MVSFVLYRTNLIADSCKKSHTTEIWNGQRSLCQDLCSKRSLRNGLCADGGWGRKKGLFWHFLWNFYWCLILSFSFASTSILLLLNILDTYLLHTIFVIKNSSPLTSHKYYQYKYFRSLKIKLIKRTFLK